MGKSVKPQTHKQAFLPKSHYTRTGFDHQGLVQPWALEAKCLPKSKGVLIAWIVFKFKNNVVWKLSLFKSLMLHDQTDAPFWVQPWTPRIAPRDAQHEHEVPSCFCDLSFGNLDGSKHIYILSRHKKHPQKCVSKMMDPKKYPGNGQASLIYFNLEKAMDSRNILTSGGIAPATTWMLVADAARSQVPIAGPSLGICPWSVWLLLNPLLSCYTSFQPPAVISGDRITPIYKPP